MEEDSSSIVLTKKHRFPSSTLPEVVVYGLLLPASDRRIILTRPARRTVDDTFPGWDTKQRARGLSIQSTLEY
jgi:hypothetical protein